MLLFRVAFLVLGIGIIQNTKIDKKDDNIPNYSKRLHEDIQLVKAGPIRYFRPEKDDGIGSKTGYTARRFQKVIILNDLEKDGGEVFSSELDSDGNDNYRRVAQNNANFRRNVKEETKLYQKRMYHSSRISTGITSSSLETKEFKENWQKRWKELQQDALDPRHNLTLHGGPFAMVAARPWYQPCGDPSQHDVPWGTCVLNYECEGEYRIYRGDINCGRTQLVCCAVERFRNDMNAAFDLSFAETSQFSTSSEEKARIARGSKENRRRKKMHKSNLIRITRKRQKRKMKKLIRKLIKESQKQLSRAFRNNTIKRALAMMNMKKLVKAMKQKFRKERQELVRKNNEDLIQISEVFAKKISKMRYLNLYFLTNETFREIVVNGTMKRNIARKVLEAYPELVAYPEMKALQDTPEVIQNARRSGSRRRKRFKQRDYLQYDIDYGIPHY